MPNVQSINPYTQQQIFEAPYIALEELPAIIHKSEVAQANWANNSLEERAKFVHKIAQSIQDKMGTYALLATQEMGKPLAQSRAELEKCIWALRYFANNAAAMLAPQHIDTQHPYSSIHFEPLGTVLAVMPWNFPYWQVFRAMGPILMGGNAMLLKHASNVSQCALAIAEIVENADLPSGVFQTMLLESKHVEQVLAHPAVQAVTFTGSTDVGKLIAQQAGKHLKKQVLELGGSDAYIVAQDADLEKAATLLVQSRLNNAGQSCIGAKRFIVEEPIAAHFLSLVATEMDKYTLGHPEEQTTTMGPLYSTTAQTQIHSQVQIALKHGAQLYKGGYIPEQNGAFYAPTILTHVHKGNPAYTEEFFGPVALVLIAKDLDDAISIANDTQFGLGGGIFIGDEQQGIAIANKRIKAGSVAVNACVSSDPRMPFGGIKESGYGRELHQFGMMEFVNIKAVVAS